MSGDLANRRRVGRGALLAPAAWFFDALALVGVGATAILSVTDLWETPDTLCGQLFNRTGGFCDPISDRRAVWVSWVAGLTMLLVALAVLAHRGRRRGGRPRPPAIVAGLLVIAVAAGVYVVWLLAHGVSDPLFCGSTLSRVDPYGVYSPGRDVSCAPSYAADRLHAWITGAVASVAFVAAGVVARVRR